MTYVKTSVPKSGNNPGAPRPKDPTIILVHVNDIETFPARDSKGVKITDNIALKAGAKAIGIYATPSSISRARTTEGADEDSRGIRDTVTFSHPGNTLELDEFVQNNLGEPFVIITRECGDNLGTRLHGDPCNPMKFEVEGQDDNEGVRSTITFTQPLPSRFVSAHYRGQLPALADDGGSDGVGI